MSDGKTLGTVVGGVLGFFTGGVGWALGAALGGVVGGLLDPASNSQQPQRLEDLKVSVSTYGAGIPQTWGNDVPPGTWIWTTDIQEVPQYYGSGGKGGGEEGPSSYFYMIHGLVCLGKAPPDGVSVAIRKVFKDGQLVWDGSTGLSVLQALATEENPYVGLQLLRGDEAQLPPAFIEIWEGAGNVPGYRGLLTLLVVGLETPGGRVPQLSVEVCIGSEIVRVNVLFNRVDDNDFSDAGVGRPYFAPLELSRASGSPSVDSLTIGTWRPGSSDVSRTSYEYGADGTFYTKEIVNPDIRWPVDLGGPFVVGMLDEWAIRSVRFQKIGEGALPVYLGPFNTVPQFNLDHLLPTSEYLCGAMISSDEERLFVFTSDVNPASSTGAIINKWYEFLPELESVMRAGVVDPPLVKDAIGFGASKANWDGPVGAFGSDYTTAWTAAGGAFQKYEIDSDLNFKAVDDEILVDGVMDPYAQAVIVAGAKVYTVSGTRMVCVWPRDVLQPAEADVAAIIEDQCATAGLEADQYSVAIDDTVWGYTFNKSPASARSNIAPLLTYSAGAQVEEDAEVKFFSRSAKASVAFIGYDELACVEDGQEAGDPFPLTRANAQECPRSVTVSYLNPSFDYQVSTETAQRMTVDSELDEQVELGLVMTPDRAATIAHRILYERWVAQMTRTFKVSRKFADLSPGDVVTIEHPFGTTGQWMLSKLTDTGVLIEGECIPADADLLVQTVSGSGGYQPQQIAPLAPPTRLVLLDSAILRDADDTAGIYAAMAGYAEGWKGAYLYAGDDAASLSARGNVTTPAVMGFLESSLTDYPQGNVDESNVVIANVSPNALSAISRDALLSGVSNVAAVGVDGRWEIIKFQRADDLGGGRYRLSGLLRGLQGTEWAAALHQSGDTIVLMSAGGVLRPNFDAGAIGQSKAYKAVTVGRRFDSASSKTAINTGEGLRPLSPTTLRKAFSGSDIVLTWGRRSRLSNQWWLGIVPLGEEAERYEVEICTAGFASVKRTLASTSPTVTYTSADQVADFGSNQTTLNVRVYQISGVVGRGHALQQTI